MKKILFLFAIVFFLFVSQPVLATKPIEERGFDEFGYNNTARIFNGTGMSWCMGKVGDITWCNNYLGDYANDNIVMKWNEAWDNCNDTDGNQEDICLGAWTTNMWHGMGKDGSKSVWQYKFIWVGSALQSSPYWVEGGTPIWGNYEVILDQGKDPSYGDGHFVFVHTSPNGLGHK